MIWAVAVSSWRTRWRARLGLVMVLALAAATVIVGLSVRGGAAGAVETARRAAAAPDLVLWGTTSGLKRVADADIVAAGPLRAVAAAEVIGPDGGSEFVLVSEVPEPDAVVGRLALRAGRRPGPGERIEVVVEPGVAPIGSTLTVRRQGHIARVEVVGIATELSMCGAPTCSPARLFATTEGFQAATGLAATQAQQSRGFHVRSGVDFAAVGDRLQSANRLGVARVITWPQTRASLLGPDTFLGGFVSGLGAFVLFAALLVTAGVISAQISSRSRELAIIGALGAGPRSVSVALLAELGVLALFSTLLAVPLAWLMTPWTQGLASGVIGRESGLSASIRPVEALIAGAMVFIGTLTSGALAIRSAVKRPLVDSIRDEVVAGRPRLRWVFRRGGFVIPLGLQDPFTRPLRATIALLGLAVAAAAAFVGLGLDATTSSLLDKATRPSDRRDAVAWPTDDQTPEDLLAVVSASDGVAAAYTVRADTATTTRVISTRSEAPEPAETLWFQAFAHGGDARVEPVHMVQGRWLRGNDEAVVAFGLAGRAGWRIGDRVSFNVGDDLVAVKVVGLYRDVYGGNALRYRIERLRQADPTASAGVVQIIGEERRSPAALRTAVQTRIGTTGQVVASRDPAWIASALRTTLTVVSALLLVVGLAQLVAAWSMTLREQRRDLAVLHAMGATTGQLIGRSVLGATLVASSAAVFGCVIGWAVLHTIIRYAIDGQGLGPGVLRFPGVVATAVLVVGTVGVAAALAAAMTARVCARNGTLALRTTT